MLRLPSSIELLGARIRFLRITVPADIYSSGIVCEANDIDIHVKVLPEEAGNGKYAKRRGPSSHQSPSGHEAGGDHILPKATDLAESFLETEPKEEKEELEAAISTRSQYLSRDAGNISDEEEEQFGLGDEYTSLPSFVARFIKGVVDRLSIVIKGVSLRLDMGLSQDGMSKRHPQEQPDLVSGLLTVGDLSVGAVSTLPGNSDDHEETGRRRISLADISVSLISDPVVFSNYSRFGSPGSPATTMRAKRAHDPSWGRAGSPSPPPSVSSHSDSMLAMTRSTIFEPRRDLPVSPQDSDRGTYTELANPEDDTQQHMEESAYSSYGQFTDAVSYGEDRDQADTGGNLLQSSDYQLDDRPLDNPSYLDSVIFHSQMEEEDESASTPSQEQHNEHREHHSEPRPESSTMIESRMHQSRVSEVGGLPGAGERGMHMSSASVQGRPRSPDHENRLRQLDTSAVSTSPFRRISSDASESSHVDLSESRIYSHDEAQSMYMSAISQGPAASRSFTQRIPGSWESSSSIGGDTSQVEPESEPVVGESKPDNNAEQEDESMTSTPKLTAQPESSYREQPEQVFSETPSLVGPGMGRLTVAKKFLEIDKFSILLPSGGYDDDIDVDEKASRQHSRSASSDSGGSGNLGETVNLHESTVENDMFASRAYEPPRARTESVGSLVESILPSLPRHPEDRMFHPESRNAIHDVAVDLSTVSVQFDIATGWLLIKMGKRLHNAFAGGEGKKKDLTEEPAQPAQNRPEAAASYNLTVNKLTVSFVEHLFECPTSLEGPQLYRTFSPYASTWNSDVFLRITSAWWKVHYLLSGDDTSKLRLDVTKFAFGFATEDILSFDEDLKLRESTRDISSPVRADVSVTVVNPATAPNVIVTTLPLLLNLRIQRLEEALGWFGGLSTILEVGSSISSVSTARGAATDPPRKHRSHGVRFETCPPAAGAGESRPPSSAPWKVNVRIGGVVIDLIGEALYKLKTSAVKVISRSEAIGAQIDRAKLTGPISLNGARGVHQPPPAWITLENTRVEYVFSPKEVDLDRLLSLITPSKDKYDEDDDIMLDTLFRQRRQGAVFRVTVGKVEASLSSLDTFDSVSQLANELSTLSTVTKYLPEDDRPGVLTLVLVKELDGQVQVGGEVGRINVQLSNAEVAHISIPSLIALKIGSVSATRNGTEELVGDAMPMDEERRPLGLTSRPVLMARFIADEMDPTFNLRAEYAVPAMVALLGIKKEVANGDVAVGMANSLANLGQEAIHQHLGRRASSLKSERRPPMAKPMRLSVLLRDCLIGLNPHDSPARGIVVLTNARLTGAVANEQEQSEAALELRKASLMVVDDVLNVGYSDNPRRRGVTVTRGSQVQSLIDMGYVPVSTISSAMASVKLVHLEDDAKSLDVELKDYLLILETCADSTQTLISILNGLQPPTPPSTSLKYRTEVMPIQDMLESFTGDAFAADRQVHRGEGLEPITESEDVFGVEAVDDDDIDYVGDFPPPNAAESASGLGLADFTGALDAAGPSSAVASLGNLQEGFDSQVHISSSVSELDFQEDHFSKQSAVGGTAHRWDSAHNTYGLSNDSKLQKSPLRIRVRDVHVIWNLFDGYDWQRTRDTISKAVKEVEAKATERRARTAASRASPDRESDNESVIGDFLFNSIYIGIPANRDPRELNQDINREIDDDLTSETMSYATSTTVTSPTARRAAGGGGETGATGSSPHRKKKLRLSRSKHHKMTFELKGVSADFVVFPPDSGETQSSLDVRVKDLEIFDHVPTSTWKKFATYMREAGERESGTSMVHLEALTVKPVADLAASEIVLKAAILPLRLHIDQDAMDFMSRFFEFRNESLASAQGGGAQPGDVPFLQRVEVHAVPVKLDFKPKRVDYAGLRSGRTTEFMNFFVLDEADMVLRHVIVYGVSGFDKLGHTLNDIWMPDIKQNQLPNVLAGLAPLRSLVNVGGGVKDLVVVPMREYRKDGRIVRSIQKGAMSFAKTTSNELVKLGAKLAIGTQTVLQGAEDLLNAPGAPFAPPGVTDESGYEEEEILNRISPYADQPVGVVQGIRGAFRGLERDLLLTRDAIVAVPGEAVDGGSATAAAKAVLKRTPTIVLRPAIGMSKAVGQTLLGAGNTLDPNNRRKMEDVSAWAFLGCCLLKFLSTDG